MGLTSLNYSHDLQIYPKYFELVINNIKNFEVRKKDRDFKVGDYILLREYDPNTGNYHHSRFTGRTCIRCIKYILDDPLYCKEGYVVLGF